jgi:hypothetical protein
MWRLWWGKRDRMRLVHLRRRHPSAGSFASPKIIDDDDNNSLVLTVSSGDGTDHIAVVYLTHFETGKNEEEGGGIGRHGDGLPSLFDPFIAQAFEVRNPECVGTA